MRTELPWAGALPNRGLYQNDPVARADCRHFEIRKPDCRSLVWDFPQQILTKSTPDGKFDYRQRVGITWWRDASIKVWATHGYRPRWLKRAQPLGHRPSRFHSDGLVVDNQILPILKVQLHPSIGVLCYDPIQTSRYSNRYRHQIRNLYLQPDRIHEHLTRKLPRALVQPVASALGFLSIVDYFQNLLPAWMEHCRRQQNFLGFQGWASMHHRLTPEAYRLWSTPRLREGVKRITGSASKSMMRLILDAEPRYMGALVTVLAHTKHRLQLRQQLGWGQWVLGLDSMDLSCLIGNLKLLKKAPTQLLADVPTDTSRCLDTLRQLRFYEDQTLDGCTTWAEAHDMLVGYTTPSSRTSLEELDKQHPKMQPTERLQSLAGQTIQDFTIQFPQRPSQLQEWAKRLHNCAASYIHDLLSERTNICVLSQDDKPRFMLEITPDGAIRQFYGPCNQPAPDSLRAQVTTEIHELIRCQGRALQSA